jgi:peptidoglycan/xylan/chitin deacetylase (PgdA/CDA1 family)
MNLLTPRLDRVVSLALAGPVAQGLRQAVHGVRPAQPSTGGETIPVLMYHSIADDVDNGVHPYFRTVTRAARFAEQVEFLRQRGYQGVTLANAACQLRRAGMTSGAVPTSDHKPAHKLAQTPVQKTVQKPVVLSFDDGFRDFYTTAFPILQRAGFSATVFVSTDFIGKAFLTGRMCLDAHELRELRAHGMEVGSHSASHRHLVELPVVELAQELNTSKEVLQDITDHGVVSFSYPYRFPQQNRPFTRVLADLLEKAGYKNGVTTTLGRACAEDDVLFLPRLPVNDCDDIPLFNAKLNGHYDWLRSGQNLRKNSRAWMQKLGLHT